LVVEERGKSSGIPHLAKNERDVGHPALVEGLESPFICSLDPYQLGLDGAGDFGPAGFGQHVDFAAHAEFREIDAWFH
jgi:hypothetical protein